MYNEENDCGMWQIVAIAVLRLITIIIGVGNRNTKC